MHRQTQLILLCVALSASCGLSQSSSASEAALAVRLAGGQGRSYALSTILRISVRADTMRVVAASGIDSYPLESIIRVDSHLDDWAGVDDPEDVAVVPRAMHLLQNQPNPFSPVTRIAFELRQEGPAVLRVYTISGRLVRTLVEGVSSAGLSSVPWDGRDEAGQLVASGVYFYVLTAPGIEERRKMVVLR